MWQVFSITLTLCVKQNVIGLEVSLNSLLSQFPTNYVALRTFNWNFNF